MNTANITKKTPRLISYRMTHDSGFAPNPFFGFLTLATCKSHIRRANTRYIGEWIAGFASKELVEKARKFNVTVNSDALVFLMEISEILTLDEYFREKRFQVKKPTKNTYPNACGDNIYHKIEGIWQQTKNISHDEGSIEDDTYGRRVLISQNFYYLGRNGLQPDSSWPNGWNHIDINVPRGSARYGYGSNAQALQKLRDYLELKYKPKRHPIGTPCLSNPHSEYRKGCPRKRNIIVNADNIRLSKCGHQPC